MPGILDDYLNSSSSNHDTTANTTLNGQQILEENSNFQPTKEEILEYAETVLELRSDETDLLWIADEGIKAPLPHGWKPVTTENGDLYYFNFDTGDSMWEHPCDEYYKNLVKSERKKRDQNNKKQLIKDSQRENSRSSKKDDDSRNSSRSGKYENSSGTKQLKPLKLKSSKNTNLDPDEERDFIKSLRSSTEVEDFKIEAPQEKKPLTSAKKLSEKANNFTKKATKKHSFDDLLKTTSESENSESKSEDDDSDFDLPPVKNQTQQKKSLLSGGSVNNNANAKNSTSNTSFAAQNNMNLTQKLEKKSSLTNKNNKDSRTPERKKSVTFEENPINNIVSDSFDDFDTKSQNTTPNFQKQDSFGLVSPSLDGFEKDEEDSKSEQKEDLSLDDILVEKSDNLRPSVSGSQGQSQKYANKLSDQPIRSSTKLSDFEISSINSNYEAEKQKLVQEKQERLEKLRVELRKSEEKERDLIELKKSEKDRRVLELEKELSKQRFELVKTREDKMEIERMKLEKEIASDIGVFLLIFIF